MFKNMAKKNVVLVIFFPFFGGVLLFCGSVGFPGIRQGTQLAAGTAPWVEQASIEGVCTLHLSLSPFSFSSCPLFQENDLLVLKRFEALNTLISCQLIVTACGAVLAIVLLQMNCHGLWLATILAFMASSMYRLEA
jgi:hypothetical protein